MSKNNLGATAEFKIKRAKKRSRKLHIWQKLLIAIAVIILAIVVAVAGAYVYYRYFHNLENSIKDGETVSEHIQFGNWDENQGDINQQKPLKRKNNCYNFLVVGCDRANWLTDVLMIATYDIDEKQFSIMQIPRDTYVTINKKLILDENGSITYENFDGDGDFGCKINSVFGHGGNLAEQELERLAKAAKELDGENNEIQMLKLCSGSYLNLTPQELLDYMQATVTQKKNIKYKIKKEFGMKYLTALFARAFGTPIDFYVELNLDGFVNVVDAIGGVDVYIQSDMDYDDPYQDLHIHLKKGQNHLDGKKAEQFIRFRSGYAAADIARIDAQKIFMTAFIKKVFSFDGVMNMSRLIEEVSENLNSNLSVADAVHFATTALELDFSKIVMLTIPGTADYLNGVSYYFVNKDAHIQTVNTYLNKYTAPIGEEYFCIPEFDFSDTSTPPLTVEDISGKQPNLGWLG